MNSALIVSDDRDIIRLIHSELDSDCQVNHISDKKSALAFLKKKRRDILFIDMDVLAESEDNHLKEKLRPFWHVYPGIEIIVMTPQSKIRQAVRIVKAGASEYLTYPLVPDEIRLVVNNLRDAMIMDSELEYLRDRQWRSDALRMLKTRNALMRQVFRKIRSVAPTKTTVLLNGETGVGKGVIAKLIHLHSNREDAQFISVHCGAIPDTLVETELFGHEKGAFTGAIQRKLGRFEIARDGTLFLDEIGTITPAIQIKLLQVLQDGIFSRVGGISEIETNVRVIAASNADLKKMSEEGLFRKDLYYRLHVFPIEIPPLRERAEDIPCFAEYFLEKMNRVHPKDICDIHPLAMDALMQYTWPGNIRELENLMERAYILETSSVLTPESFPAELFETQATATLSVDASLPLAKARQQLVEAFERQYVKDILSQNRGKINKSAEVAGISTRQLNKLMHKYGIRKEIFKA